jgi:hypothetical protein
MALRKLLCVAILILSLLNLASCGGGGGGGGGSEDRPNPFNGTWRSAIQITRDNCNRAQFFADFSQNTVYSITGDTFDLDVFNTTSQTIYTGEMFGSDAMGASGVINMHCGNVYVGDFPIRIRASLANPTQATLDIQISYRCTNGPTCNIEATGIMDRISD